jgi:mycothiol synthase
VSALPPPGYTVRAATMDDFDRTMELFRVADQADWGAPDFTAEMLRYEWTMPELDMGTDTWLVERDDVVCAYGWCLARRDHRELDGYGLVHPEHRGRGLGTFLVDLRQARVAEHRRLAPSDEPVTDRIGVIGPDVAAHELLERRGYELVRHSFKMETRLEPPVARPADPDGVVIRPFDRATDTKAFHATMNEAFAEHFGWVERGFDDWLRTRVDGPDFDPGLWFVAADEMSGEVVGELAGLTTEGTGYVGNIGVRPAWRGRGIGEALLRTSLHAFAERGVLDVALDVDASNATGAVALYERVGMKMTRRYDTYAKVLPPG